MARIDRKQVAAAALQRLRNEALPTGKRLRALREALELTQTELGAALGVSGACVSCLESGDSTPKTANAFAIEAWSRAAARKLRLPADRAIPPRAWLTPETPDPSAVSP